MGTNLALARAVSRRETVPVGEKTSTSFAEEKVDGRHIGRSTWRFLGQVAKFSAGLP